MTTYLQIRDENGRVERKALSADRYVIGRSASADIQLERPTVSRAHAMLTRSGEKWTIADLGSRSGTRVNGEAIVKRPLTGEDYIQISRFSLQLFDETDSTFNSSQTQLSWSHEQAAPSISTLAYSTSPKIDLSHISALDDFGRALLDETDSGARLRALCDLVAGGVLSGRWALALELESESSTRPPRILCASPEKLIGSEDIHISRTTIRAMLESNAPVLANNFDEGAGHIEMTIVDQGPATGVAACPLMSVGEKRRLLYVNVPPEIASTEWLALISLAANKYQQAESTWREREAAERQAGMERDLSNARTIQMSILPEAPRIDELDIAWSFRPCDTVGGDLLDIIAMPDGRVMITIADVSGHGLPAALATLSVHSVVQTCIRSSMTPEQVMNRLNDHLCDFLPDGRFVTMSAIVIDLATGQTQCINAGHCPPTVIKTDGSTRSLASADHMVLGVIEQDMDAAQDTLEPGETLFLYTDGLTEMRLETEQMLLEEGLTNILGELHGKAEDATSLKQSVSDKLEALKGPSPDLDDQTFLIVKRK